MNNKEAEYFQKKRLEDTLAVTAPADAPSRQLTNEELMAKVQGQIAESKEPVIEGGIKTPIDTEIADFDIAQTNEQRALEQDFYDSPEAVDRTTKSNSMLPDTKAVTDSYTRFAIALPDVCLTLIPTTKLITNSPLTSIFPCL